MKIGPAAPRALTPPGTTEWCKGTLLALRSICERRRIDEDRFNEVWADIQQYRVWEVFPEDQPFGTPERLLHEVTGEDEAALRSRMKDLALGAVKTRPGAGAPLGSHNNPKGRAGGTNVADVNVSSLPRGGNRASYLLRRVARFDTANGTDLLGEYERGTYPSARAAAIAAGIITPPTGLDLLRRAWKRATADEREQFIAEIA